MTDLKALNDKISSSDYPVNVIACKAGMSVQSLHNKRTGKREFNVAEILAITKVLSLTKKEREKIFGI